MMTKLSQSINNRMITSRLFIIMVIRMMIRKNNKID